MDPDIVHSVTGGTVRECVLLSLGGGINTPSEEGDGTGEGEPFDDAFVEDHEFDAAVIDENDGIDEDEYFEDLFDDDGVNGN